MTEAPALTEHPDPARDPDPDPDPAEHPAPGEGPVLPDRVRALAIESFEVRTAAVPRGTPVYIYDLAGLRAHAARIRAALPGVELLYAVKANPDPAVLRALEPYVDGMEVSSGGELAHVGRVAQRPAAAFGGPGKTDEELELALRLGTERIHVESPHELRRLASVAAALDRTADVLLRADLRFGTEGAALSMNGPFGMDEAALGECARLVTGMPRVRLRGVHAHLASGLDAPALIDLAGRIAGWTRSRAGLFRAGDGSDGPDGPPGGRIEINLGGGMSVDYARPSAPFDWTAYGRGLARLRRPGEMLRIEPGRAVTAYHGWYVTEVLDVKRTHGETFAVLHGGTHHLRTPVAKGHDQPFTVIPRRGPGGGTVPGAGSGPVTLVGRLCTPKDVFARRVAVRRIEVGDLVAFGMAGAYAWNISHHDFLMHQHPRFVYTT